jgi:hypothetical protein
VTPYNRSREANVPCDAYRMSKLSTANDPSAPLYVNCMKPPTFGEIPPARKRLASCGNDAPPFCVSCGAFATCEREVTIIPDSVGMGDNESVCLVTESPPA